MDWYLPWLSKTFSEWTVWRAIGGGRSGKHTFTPIFLSRFKRESEQYGALHQHVVDLNPQGTREDLDPQGSLDYWLGMCTSSAPPHLATRGPCKTRFTVQTRLFSILSSFPLIETDWCDYLWALVMNPLIAHLICAGTIVFKKVTICYDYAALYRGTVLLTLVYPQ